MGPPPAMTQRFAALHGDPGVREMATKLRKPKREDELFLGYRIRKLESLFVAVPLEWAGQHGETLVARDLPTLREEIRRWWYRVGD